MTEHDSHIKSSESLAASDAKFVRHMSWDNETIYEDALSALRGLETLCKDSREDMPDVQGIGYLIQLVAAEFGRMNVGIHVPQSDTATMTKAEEDAVPAVPCADIETSFLLQKGRGHG